SYIERRGGMPFYSHLRGGAARGSFREDAVARAFELYEQGKAEMRSEAELGGRALLVLQRALLAAEDVGGLLHALSGPDPWARLVSTKLPQLDSAFEQVLSDDP